METHQGFGDKFNMAEMVKKAQAQNKAREANKQNISRPPQQRRSVVIARESASDIESAKDGDYFVGEDGVGAIVIDNEERARKMQENDKTGKALLELVHSDALITDANEYRPNYGENAPEGYDPGVEWMKNNPFDKKTKDMADIKRRFSKLTYGFTGLVDANSPEARIMAEAMEKVRTGEVVLPTPEEFEQQKREAEERKRQRRERLSGKKQQPVANRSAKPKTENVSTKKRTPEPAKLPDKEGSAEPQMADMPENVIIRKGVLEQMSEIMNETASVTPVSNRRTVAVNNETPVPKKNEEAKSKPEQNVVVPQAPVEEDPLQGIDLNEELPMPEHEVGGIILDEPAPAAAQKPEERKPIDLFATQERIDEARENGELDVEDSEEEETSETDDERPNVTVINVPEGEAATFMQNMPLDTYNKVVRSKAIQVNQVELKDVPTATRRIDNIADYRALAKRRANKKPTELTERALLNSGFVITVKPATSMEMSSVFKSMAQTDLDWQKAYSFCYEHTVETSIGKLSYNDFVLKVSPLDIETILDGIYEISEPPERNIEVTCGVGDGGCGNPFNIKIDVNTLQDVKDLPTESKERIKKIIDVRNEYDAAREFHMDSPSMQVKIMKFGDRYIYLRSTSGNMLIERNDRLPQISDQYGALVALLVLYVDKISIVYSDRDDAEPDTIDLTTLDIICEELRTLEDDELDQLKSVISDELRDFPTMKYSLKGHFVCPNCGLVKTKIPCAISDLIFQKVQRMLE